MGMKTLVDIDEAILKEAMGVSGAASKKEAITLALEELIKFKHRQQLKSRVGSGMVRPRLSDLIKSRRRREKMHKVLS